MTIKAIRLEGMAVYEPATHSVYKIGETENQISLVIPASLFLLNLLQKKGEVVSHADLLLRLISSVLSINVKAIRFAYRLMR